MTVVCFEQGVDALQGYIKKFHLPHWSEAVDQEQITH
jgi:hypothetical protein